MPLQIAPHPVDCPVVFSSIESCLRDRILPESGRILPARPEFEQRVTLAVDLEAHPYLGLRVQRNSTFAESRCCFVQVCNLVFGESHYHPNHTRRASVPSSTHRPWGCHRVCPHPVLITGRSFCGRLRTYRLTHLNRAADWRHWLVGLCMNAPKLARRALWVPREV